MGVVSVIGLQRRPARFEASFDGETGTLNGARTEFERWASEQGMLGEIDDVLLVVSELCSNAVEASPGRPYTLRATVVDDVLRLAVENRSDSAPPPRSEWGPTDVLAPRGRGLRIVDSLADSVEITTKGDHITVAATFNLRS